MSVDYYNYRNIKSLTKSSNNIRQIGGDVTNNVVGHPLDNIHSISNYESTTGEQEQLVVAAQKAIQTSLLQEDKSKEAYYVEQARTILYKVNKLKEAESKHEKSVKNFKEIFDKKVKDVQQKKNRIAIENAQREEEHKKELETIKLRNKKIENIKKSPSDILNNIQQLNVMHNM